MPLLIFSINTDKFSKNNQIFPLLSNLNQPTSRIQSIMAFQRMVIPVLAIAFALLAFPAYGQMPAFPCTSSMLTSFTPCMNYVTNSSLNGTSPTADCCNVLKSFVSNGTGCLCLIATGAVPFNIPINRSLALSLPRACNMPGVPLQCQGIYIYA